MLLTLLFTKLQYLLYSIAILYATHTQFKIGSFLTYGFEWIGSRAPAGSPHTPIQDKLFPKLAACEIKRWGATGIDTTRGMCVMPQNVQNSYLFLVFWGFLLLTILGNITGLLIALVQYCCKPVGYRKLTHHAMWSDFNLRALYYSVGGTGRVVLHQLAENLHPTTFERLVRRYWWLKRNETVQYNGHVKLKRQ